MLSCEKLVTYLDNLVGDERSGSLYVADVGTAYVRVIDAVQTQDIRVTLGLECGEVELELLLATDTVALHYMSLLKEVRQVEHNLLGDTSYIDACATNDSVFNHTDCLTEGSRATTRGHASTAGSNDHVVKALRLTVA